MLHPATFHQPERTIPWRDSQPVFGNSGVRSQPLYNPYFGNPNASTNAYNSQLAYSAQPRESQFDATVGNHMLPGVHNMPHGQIFSPQPGYMAAQEYYTSSQFHGLGQEGVLYRPLNHGMPMDGPAGRALPGVVEPTGQGTCGVQRESHLGFDKSIGRGARTLEKEFETTPRAHQATRPTASAPTPTRGSTLRQQPESTTEHTPVSNTSNVPVLLSTNSSKSPPPYMSSQRKHLRVAEKFYLKEVKRSIAEGRVPQVRLEQNNSGDIVQYKSQFLNALKLAALAIVPHAEIDIKNQSTMQDIMEEVKRQFIIEKPLPEGMVAGFLQRLYKRNRAVYHRHWTVHGDHKKPDDCPLAAWLQLVDYWNSSEGSKECERNKANASAKKGAPVRFHPLPL